MSVETKCGICKNDEQTLGRVISPHAVCNECMKWGAHTIAQRDALRKALEHARVFVPDEADIILKIVDDALAPYYEPEAKP